MLVLIGCTEGGCGDEPEAKSSSSGPVTSGASSSRGGGGEVGIPAGAAEPRKSQAAPGKEEPKSGAAAASLISSLLEPVDAATFKPKVAKKPEALVSLYFPGCSDCDLVAPVLKNISKDFKGKIEVYRMDSSLPENLALLPKGFTVRDYPSFVLYRKGEAVSWRQGLPFEARKASSAGPGESPEEYQGRLSGWFRDSLSRGTLAAVP